MPAAHIGKSFGILLISFFLSSYFFTESWTWGYQNKWTNWRTYIPTRQVTFTVDELAKYDGSDPNLPIYIALFGEVFDVSNGAAYYGKGSGYNAFAGRDATRAYVTGCFNTHLTHDLRGLTKEELKSLRGWLEFYQNHHSYHKVGNVVLPPIDPDTPIPEPCNDSVGQKN
ncbi:4287_t:CDS:2 [Paraglomus brasilianum]|uniref:4287_t:CDS:1 n=1 Tax=Paraglomus brasilianum TaxID=144538 RepID=A0A9N9G0W0_9GLOM|nr:4287_t:CDS:2 [Paraglomus brasilianum]